ncbi:MAG: exopolysaccharide biosynthesis protein [Rickettsiales bacterium]
MSNHARRTSAILQEIIDSADKDGTISLGEFMKLLGDRTFCLAILVFSLPNSLPVPGIPGFSTITGLPIIFIAMQLLAGRSSIWLPKKVAQKTFTRRSAAKMLSKALPAVKWLEKFLRPRLVFVTSPFGERLLGALFIILSGIIILPIPGGNFLPGLSMSLIALGMLSRDGLFVLSAIAFSIASVVFMIEIIRLFFEAVISAFHSIF